MTKVELAAELSKHMLAWNHKRLNLIADGDNKKLNTCKKKQSEHIVTMIFEIIEAAMMREEKVCIKGFGTFNTRSHSRKNYRNPITGEPFSKGPGIRPWFKWSKTMRGKVGRIKINE